MPPCYDCALNCKFVYLAMPGRRSLFMRMHTLLVCGKHETGLVYAPNDDRLAIANTICTLDSHKI